MFHTNDGNSKQAENLLSQIVNVLQERRRKCEDLVSFSSNAFHMKHAEYVSAGIGTWSISNITSVVERISLCNRKPQRFINK